MENEHPIQRYCRSNRISQAQFARRARYDPASICSIVKGRISPSMEGAIRIVAASAGEISVSALAAWQPIEPETAGEGS